MFSLTDSGLANLLEKGTQLKKVRLEGCKYAVFFVFCFFFFVILGIF